LHDTLFIEPNPVPVKWVLQQMGRIEGGIRLPLVPFASECHSVVLASLGEAGILQ
jgi:4-hydroxy-tetrahydrodipicolinate synthase